MRVSTLIGFCSLICLAALSTRAAPQDERGNTSRPMRHQEYDEAIAPFIAQARATYPAAKKRFLAGLPPNYSFAVWTRLYQAPEKGQRGRAEDVFVDVHAIKGGIVYGVIANTPIFVTNYRQGEAVKLSESDVINWVIVRPDGTEEGNYVGKFLEHWKKAH